MNCKESKQQMLQYIDGSLDAESTAKWEEHLAVCSECQKEYEFVRRIYGQVDSEKSEFTFNPYLSAKVVNRISEKNGQHKILLTPKRYALVTSLSVAAIFAGVLLGSFSSKIMTSSIDKTSSESMQLLAEEYFPSSDNNIYDIQVDEIENNQ
ncbi:MAG: anti-sigma factor [Bacteroidales bacterium]